MKVVHISSSGKLDGGAELCLVDLIKYEIENGINPYVLLPYKGELQEKLNSMGVETDIIHYLPWRHHRSEPKLKSSAIFLIKIVINLIQEVHIYHFLRKHKVDLVHINTTAVYAGSISAHILNIPLIWHLREFNGQPTSYDFYCKSFSYWLLSNASKCIAVSKVIDNFYSEHLNNSIVIYDSMEEPRHERQSDLFSTDITKIILIGNKKPDKGQMDAIKALSQLRDLPIHLTLIGKDLDEAYVAEMHDYTQKHSLANLLTDNSFDSEAKYKLLESDIALNCSRSESFGRTTVEALMSGCLVIGNNNSCTAELLTNGRGLLYEGSEDLSVKIRWAINHPAESKDIAKKGVEFGVGSFQTGNKNIVNLFKSML